MLARQCSPCKSFLAYQLTPAGCFVIPRGKIDIIKKKKKKESGSVSMLCFSCGLRDVLQVCNSLSLRTLVSLTWLTPLFCLCTIPFSLTQLRNITVSCLKMNFPLPV